MVKQLTRALRSRAPTKDILNVKAAIRFNAFKRKQREEAKKEYKEGKEYRQSRQRMELAQKKEIKESLRNAKEDWMLGPLRPNRAVGSGKEVYGTTSREVMDFAKIPEYWRTKPHLKKHLQKKLPDTIFQDASPITVDDRVVLLVGKDKGRIGVVTEVHRESNTLRVKDLNKVWVDSSIFSTMGGGDSKQEFEKPLRLEDVRLVVPQTIDGIRQDVIVESVTLEKYSTGRNLFTGEENVDIPEEQRVDPETDEPIWRRYIAGTRTRIEWPWEETAQKKQDARENARAKGIPLEGEEDSNKPNHSDSKESLSTLDRIRQGIGRVTGRKIANDQDEKSQSAKDISEGEDAYADEEQPLTRPREREPAQYDGDTTRNYIEDEQYMTWVPSLGYKPFPEGVLEEIVGPKWNQRRVDPKADDLEKRVAEIRARKAEVAEKKRLDIQKHVDTMKTPLQVKWELEQAAKAANPQRDEIPMDVLVAIGEHMAANRDARRAARR